MISSILYLHGFASSPASWKVRALADALNARKQGYRLICPSLSPVPNEAIAQAEAIIESRVGPLTLVGSSLGGYYATWLAEKHLLRAALINPAVIAPVSLEKYLGKQTNLHTGREFEFTEEHLAQLRALEAGFRIAVAMTPEPFPPGVDTEEDLRRAEAWLAGRGG